MSQQLFILLLHVLQLPVFLLASFAAALAARKMHGGVFASGMRFISAGMLVSAFSNLYLFVNGLPGIELLGELFGPIGDTLLALAYPVVSSVLLLIGFSKFITLPHLYVKTSPSNQPLKNTPVVHTPEVTHTARE
jgi:hypothetical protein